MPVHNNKDIHEAAGALQKLVPLPSTDNTYEQLLAALSEHINQLINHNFSALVQLLYRMDIPEKKLKELLAKEPANAGDVIADLMIQRQLQKIESRRKFKQQEDDIPEEDRW